MKPRRFFAMMKIKDQCKKNPIELKLLLENSIYNEFFKFE